LLVARERGGSGQDPPHRSISAIEDGVNGRIGIET
jgi:hypothetical protein